MTLSRRELILKYIVEYFIKNVGLYFNETRTGNFLSKENTIKSNMGLGE